MTKRKQYSKICLCCGREFKATPNNAKFCDKCRNCNNNFVNSIAFKDDAICVECKEIEIIYTNKYNNKN